MEAAISASRIASSMVSAPPMKPAGWQNVAVATPVTFCKSGPFSPFHSTGTGFFWTKLPGFSGIHCQLKPPLKEGNTTNRMSAAFVSFEALRAPCHGTKCSKTKTCPSVLLIASSTIVWAFAVAMALSKTLSKTTSANATALRKASSLFSFNRKNQRFWLLNKKKVRHQK